MKTISLNQKSRAYRQARPTLNQLYKLRNIRRIMLAIAVNLNVNIIAKSLSILMARLDRSTDTKVLWQVQYVDTMLSTKLKRSIL